MYHVTKQNISNKCLRISISCHGLQRLNVVKHFRNKFVLTLNVKYFLFRVILFSWGLRHQLRKKTSQTNLHPPSCYRIGISCLGLNVVSRWNLPMTTTGGSLTRVQNQLKITLVRFPESTLTESQWPGPDAGWLSRLYHPEQGSDRVAQSSASGSSCVIILWLLFWRNLFWSLMTTDD